MSRRVGSPKAVGDGGDRGRELVRSEVRRGHDRYSTYAVVEIPRALPGEAAMPTEAEVLEALRPVEDPELHRSIVDLDMVRGIAIDGDRVG